MGEIAADGFQMQWWCARAHARVCAQAGVSDAMWATGPKMRLEKKDADIFLSLPEPKRRHTPEQSDATSKMGNTTPGHRRETDPSSKCQQWGY